MNVILATLLLLLATAGSVLANTNSLVMLEDIPYKEPYDGSYEVIFFETIPEPGKVYRVIYSTLHLVASETNPDRYDGFCLVALEEMPRESADSYLEVVKFLTKIRSVIFGPNSELPIDAVAFEYSFECIEYEDMRAGQ